MSYMGSSHLNDLPKYYTFSLEFVMENLMLHSKNYVIFKLNFFLEHNCSVIN